MSTQLHPKEVIDLWYNQNVDVSSRVIYMGPLPNDNENPDTCWSISEYSISNIIKSLHLLMTLGKEAITIVGSTYGGNFYDAMALYDAISRTKNDIRIVMEGYCMSAGTIILQSANMRILSKNCRLLLHYGSDGFSGTAKDFENRGEESKACNTIMEDIYLKRIRQKHPKFKRADLQEYIKYDKYISATEAVKLGLADRRV